MITTRNSFPYWIAVLLPMWLTAVEQCRVGTDTVNFFRLSWAWTARKRHADWLKAFDARMRGDNSHV